MEPQTEGDWDCVNFVNEGDDKKYETRDVDELKLISDDKNYDEM